MVVKISNSRFDTLTKLWVATKKTHLDARESQRQRRVEQLVDQHITTEIKMRVSIANAVLWIAAGAIAQNITTGKLGDAAQITNNPPGASYIAVFEGRVTGEVTAESAATGKGVLFSVTVNGLPKEGGPFGMSASGAENSHGESSIITHSLAYHIHDQPVPTDGNCNGTLAHLDPYQRGQTPACDATKPETCEVGDLSGKYGKFDGHTNTIR